MIEGSSKRAKTWRSPNPVLPAVWLLVLLLDIMPGGLASRAICAENSALAAESSPGRFAKPTLPLVGDTTADAGLVDAAVQTDAVHVYTLKNATNAPVRVSGVRGACGCEHMALLENGQMKQSIMVAPGQSFQVRLEVRLAGQAVGSVAKSAWVTGGANGAETLANLSLTFRVRQAVAFDPPRIDLGDIPAGGTASASVVVHVDRAAGSAETQIPDLTSDSSSVTITKVGTPRVEIRDGKSGAAITFRLKVSNDSMAGLREATVRMVWPGSDGKSTSQYALPVSYRIVGSLSVAPQAIYFGSVAKGSSATRALIITGQSINDLLAIRATSPSPYIQPQGISSTSAKSAGASGVMQIILTKDAPSGALQTFLSIRTPNGQQTNVPVIAFIGN